VPRQTYAPLEIKNERSSILEIMVEVYPDRYLLRPGERMAIEADPDGSPFMIYAYDDGLQVFPGNTAGAAVTIDGLPVEPDWDTQA
jgi:hypothetical protein